MDNNICHECLNNTTNPMHPSVCINCQNKCYCQNKNSDNNRLLCKFCINISKQKLLSNNDTKYMENFPCYCSGGKSPDYFFLCLDCQQDYCLCENKKKYLPKCYRKYHCSFCFEKEYNQFIEFEIKKDF